ncbi:AraC family transcriptional regulator [Pseudomonas auratipiscis]|uniref:Helix-turn-helix domain-containing protein n=1 Tax=Pseudomonas auratipiscis TaxID=3115853 RepID=A0AB35WS05_9PSED|nr:MULTISPECIES: helix-turn-helix domain-containing protein [unclassified Pseudomonas]MEE1864859.1 helix-turn-helix domain-containing protein [Pseudomonas sp. 120P]MEE1956200.1 helix-turn-helix domain-containing protein [Pseudomonas sp. 119P]
MKKAHSQTVALNTFEQPWFVLNSSHYSAIASVHPAISHFYSLDIAQSSNLMFAVPDGCVDIVVDCDSTRPTARVCGTPLEARQVELLENHHYFGVRFTPGVIPGFINALAQELTEQELNLLDVTPRAQGFFDEVINTALLSEQIDAFNRFLVPDALCKTSVLTASVIRTVLQHKGDIRIQQLEELSGYTTRTIHRQFSQDTGMTPKAFCRIIRCQAALNAINSEEDLSFSELAMELGFTDQSHFLRDFKKLVSTTPHVYQQRITQGAYNQRIMQSRHSSPARSAPTGFDCSH